MIIFNWIAMFPLIIAVGISMLLENVVEDLNPGIPMLIIGGLLLITDVWYRFFRDPNERGAFHPRKGGHIMFLPAWLYGAVFLPMAILVVVKGG